MSEDLRGLMFSIAYRMLGSVSEAEDVVQEAFVRLQAAEDRGEEIRSREAYATTITTRLAIDELRSARARRETYVGVWLPEPIVADTAEGPERAAEMADSLSMAFLVLAESLSPIERAVFLLREVFGYGYDEVAEIVGRSEANCRQILVRARRHIEDGRPRFEADRAEAQAVLQRFVAAAEAGEMDQLVGFLAEDVAVYGDGGGKATAAPRPVFGRQRVGAFLAGLFRQAKRQGLSVEPAVVNGGAGLLVRDPDGRLVAVQSVEVAGGQIQTVRSVVNPDKLAHLGPTSDLALRSDPGLRKEPR